VKQQAAHLEYLRRTFMKCRLNSKFWLVLGVLCLGLAPGLWAQSSNIGCGYLSNPKPAAALKPASFELISKGDGTSAPITGFWKVQVSLPDGTVIDNAYVTWHADGTEIMNSSRPPISGNFCMGVWKRTGRSTYKLNHFAMEWDPTGTTFIGPLNLKEEVVLDRSHNSYVGTFTVDQYDTNGNVIGHAAGQVTGQRITVD
jgi:hypothetical protein